ncbi:MAG: DNA replication and repair protein RecF [Verrucomicrobiota bacterium]|nr:DNA replication and repair protein RecF [Verrucomicrobiota bacterium]
MRFLNIRLQNFRNMEFAELPLNSDRIFLLGDNGQGKSNLLEALGLVTAIRSFRTQKIATLARKGVNAYTLVYQLEHDSEGLTSFEIHSGPAGRTVRIDGEKVTRLINFIGRFPTVTLCSRDIMLLRGSPSDRRRFIDLTLSVVNRPYYNSLRDFNRGLSERNRLLKNKGSAAQLSAFEAEVATHACVINSYRKEGILKLGDVLRRVYEGIAEADEGPELSFRPNTDCVDAEAYCRLLRESRVRDQLIGTTQRGPHRDDFKLSLSVGGAREYASDGQQRGLCIALRFAQASLYRELLDRVPVLLADDVLGELDPFRREGFWRTCPKDIHFIATGTELPSEPKKWVVYNVKNGQVALS